MTINRFEWAINRKPFGPLPIFDVDLYNFSEAVVSPSVGSIVPGWLLVIPRLETICFANLPAKIRRNTQRVLSLVRQDTYLFGGKPWMFEHGARFCGSKAACGVDQAHLHVVPLESDLFNAVKANAPALSWNEVDCFDPWAEIDSAREYYFVSDFTKGYVAYPEVPTSQFFRRVIANMVGRATEWDYRLFSNERNAAATIRRIRSERRTESAA